jgi:hypothetical protein
MDSDVSNDRAGFPKEAGDDWSQRRLCPDGNCIGVIGPDGRCKECGRPAEGPAPEADVPTSAEESDVAREPVATAYHAPTDHTPADGDDDWSQRRLCPDGNCIGVIGPDGRCRECGRPADGPLSAP